MKQRIPCPHCGHQVRIAAWQYGQQCKCPQCKGVLEVPDLTQAQQAVESAGSLKSSSRPPEPATRPRPPATQSAPDPSSRPKRTSPAAPVTRPDPPADPSALEELPLAEVVEDDFEPASPEDSTTDQGLEWLSDELARVGNSAESGVAVPTSPPPAPPTDAPVDGEDLGLSLHAAAATPAPVYQPNDPIAIVCKLCSTRFYGVFAEVGQTKSCPDCYVDNIVPAPKKQPAGKPRPPQTLDSVRLSPPESGPRYEPYTKGELSDMDLHELRTEHDRAPPRGDDGSPAKVIRLKCSACGGLTLAPAGKAQHGPIKCPSCDDGYLGRE